MGRTAEKCCIVGFNARDNVDMSKLVDTSMDVVKRNYATCLALSLDELKYAQDLVLVVRKLFEAALITKPYVEGKLAQLNKIQSDARKKGGFPKQIRKSETERTTTNQILNKLKIVIHEQRSL